jgi:hypothetical protein
MCFRSHYEVPEARYFVSTALKATESDGCKVQTWVCGKILQSGSCKPDRGGTY